MDEGYTFPGLKGNFIHRIDNSSKSQIEFYQTNIMSDYQTSTHGDIKKLKYI